MNLSSFQMVCLRLVAMVLLQLGLTSALADPTPYFPLLSAPKQLLVAKIYGDDKIKLSAGAVGNAELAMLASIGGFQLRNNTGTGLYIEANADAGIVLQGVVSTRAVRTEVAVGSSWDVLGRLAQTGEASAAVASRYVLYNGTGMPESTDCARMGAYKYGAVMVDAALQATANGRGMKQVFDCTGKNDTWILENWAHQWPVRSLAVEQSNDLRSTDSGAMNDLTAAWGALAFHPMNTPVRQQLLAVMEPQGVVLGWGDFDELKMVPTVSSHDLLYVGSEWSHNMAVLATFRDVSKLPLKQGGRQAGEFQVDTTKHYVAFHFTDGDNVEFVDGEHPGYEFYTCPYFWGAKSRGSVPVGYGIGPDQRDLGQTVVEHLYATASNKSGAEDFFVATEPVGYTYVSRMSEAGRAENARRLGSFMHDMDLDILNMVVYRDDFKDPDQYFGPYLGVEEVKAIFAYNWDGGYENNGTIYWVAGQGGVKKPIISGRYALWVKGVQEVTSLLNQQVAKTESAAGYSLVPVSVWHPYGVDDIANVAKHLAPHIQVVSPQRLAELVRENVVPTSTEVFV